MRRLVWLTVLAMGWCPLASAAETLAFQYVPNTKEVYEVEQKSDQKLTIGEFDVLTKAATFSVSTHTLGARAGDGSLDLTEKVDVLQVNLDLPGGIVYQFDSGNADKPADNPLLEPVAKTLRATFRTPVTTVLKADHSVKEIRVPEGASAGLPQEFDKLFDAETRKKAFGHARSYLPDKPVKQGDTWDRTVEANLGNGQTLTPTIRYEYQGTVEKNGRTLHKITSKPIAVLYSMDPGSPSPLKVTQSDLKPTEGEGEVLFDNNRGVAEMRVSRMRIVGTLTMVAGGQELPGKLDLTITEKVTRRP